MWAFFTPLSVYMNLKKVFILFFFACLYLSSFGNHPRTLYINHIFFQTKQVSIDTTYHDNGKTLAFVLSIFRENPNMKIELMSHADAHREHRRANATSTQRGNNVKQWFVDRGIKGDQIKVTSWGDTRIVADCPEKKNCDKADAQNRRVEFKILSLE